MNNKITKTLGAIALAALAGAAFTGCSASQETEASESAQASLEQLVSAGLYASKDGNVERYIDVDDGSLMHIRYTCDGDAPTLTGFAIGELQGDEAVFEDTYAITTQGEGFAFDDSEFIPDDGQDAGRACR